MNFRNFLNESSDSVTVYHGSNVDFKKINPKYFMLDTSNVQEGVGLYFGNLQTAEGYGKYLKSVTLDTKYFIESHADVSVLSRTKIIKLFNELMKLDKEAMFYLITDYGIYAEVPEDIHPDMFYELYTSMKYEQIRNFQIELAQNFNAEMLTKAWNKVFPKIHGLKNSEYGFYIIINTDYKLKIRIK